MGNWVKQDEIDRGEAEGLHAMAQDVLARAVVFAREQGGTWTTTAEALNTTPEQARDQYTAAIDRWEDALDRPWDRSGRFLVSRMPDGTTEPDQTIADLDQSCLCHLDEHGTPPATTASRTAWCPPTSPRTPPHRTCTATDLTVRGTAATHEESDAYETRRKVLMAKLGQAVP